MKKTDCQYDLAVIGAGTAGLVAAFVADSLGAKVALIEENRVGGECLWTGCVPSKTLLRSARVFDLVKRCEEFGVHVEKPRIVWSAIKLRMADIRDQLKDLEKQELAKSGISIHHARAHFIAPHQLQLRSAGAVATLSAKKFIIATGSSLKYPDLPGLQNTPHCTHEALFELPALPRSLTFIGGGPISCELGQAFNRLGTKVTILQRNAQVLPREEPEISAEVARLLRNEGVNLHLGANPLRCGPDEEPGGSKNWVEFESETGTERVTAGLVVLATGKSPRTAGLNLVAAGIKFSDEGIQVDQRLQTTAAHVYACGDVTGGHYFTHAAEYEAKIAVQNVLLPLKAKVNYAVMPRVTFTDPELASAGLTLEEAKQQWGEAKVYQVPFATLDRAIIEGETSGFTRVITTGSGRILGVHILGDKAGEILASFLPAIKEGALLQEFAEAIFPYPTMAEIGHRLGNEIYKEMLDNKLVKSVLKRLI